MRLKVAIIVAAMVLLVVAPFAWATNNNAEAAVQTSNSSCTTTILNNGEVARVDCPGLLSQPIVVDIPEQAPPVVDCDVVVGNQTRVVCSALGQVILNQRLTVPTVTLPPIRVTITAPPIRVPGDTITETVTVSPRTQVIPGPTRTATAQPDNNATNRTGPPQPTASITVDGVTPSPGVVTKTETKTKPGATKFKTVVKRIGWGALASLGIFLLGLIAYIVGYRLGFGDGRKNEVRQNTKWMLNLLRRTKRS